MNFMHAALGMALIAALSSLAASWLIVATARWHGRRSLDKDAHGIHVRHKNPAPRIGGIALMAGMIAGTYLIQMEYSQLSEQFDPDKMSLLILSAAPAFLAGSIEDLTQKVSVRARMLATVSSAVLAFIFLQAFLPRLDVWLLDDLLLMIPVAVAVTVFAVAGVSNAVNIIDGFNGIAGSAVIIMLAGLGALAWQAQDWFVLQLACLGMGATAGFLLLNYPKGKLFMGDGGAYLLGFWVAETAVLLIARNPAVNTWQILAICAYPVIEVVYSMYRRKFVRKVSMGSPDRLHLHMLVYRRIVCQHLTCSEHRPWARNAMVACILSLWIMAATLLALEFGHMIGAAIALVVFQILAYMSIYARLVRGHWCLNPAVFFGLWPERRARSL